MTIRDAQDIAWAIAEVKGFHDGMFDAERDVTLLRLCLVHTEISEAAQEVKRHWDGVPTSEQKEKVAEELADAIIRIFDIAECVGVDMEESVVRKMAVNRQRPFKYGTPAQRKQPETGEVS